MALLGLALLPREINEYYIHQGVLIAIYAILLFGLDVVVGYTGEVSLAHGALFGIGAYTAGILSTKTAWPFLATLPASMAVTAFFGGVLALPALRVRGPYLAMVTLAFGTIAQILINEMDFLTNGPLGISLQKPDLWGHALEESEYYYVVLAIFFLTGFLIHRLLISRFGRAFEALHGSPVAADCMGVSVYRYKVLAFVVSAAIAGLAGSLFSFNELFIAPNSFNFELTITFLLALIMGGRKSRLGPVLGAAIVVLLPNILDDIQLFRWLAHGVMLGVLGLFLWRGWKQGWNHWKSWIIPGIGALALEISSHRLQDMTDWRLTIFGALILFVVYYLQNGIVGWLRQGKPAVTEADFPLSGEGAVQPVELERRSVAQTTPGPLLQVSHVVMSFGGLRALNDLSCELAPGQILGLIGPNGSGKSTLMNVLTGLYVPTSGEVRFKGQRISGKSPTRIALRGLARTFQNLQLFGDMTVLENVLIGLNHRYRSGMTETLLHLPRFVREEKAARARARVLLDFVGLAGEASREARHLPYGQQRLLEIARALALDPDLLLLDEPAAGLTSAEIERLIAVLHKIKGQGLALILIEHHMDVVMSVSDQVMVLDSGRCIASGLPHEVRHDAAVIKAYLGGGEEAQHAGN
ncbi:MAG: branched-chain amino acid ABC transporter ATP-binding protein/permease [Ferrovum sp.]|nr:branched-chain amino acid ABC transporter ATP-binding protein/permease [Ferrovum sp.]